ncbi:MAG: hypothetical protein V4656_03280 [Pseudomonadota bacterium]
MPSYSSPCLAALLLALSGLASFACAQPAPSVAADTADISPDEPTPTLSLTATIHADSITVRQRGNAKARIWADPGGDGDWRFNRGPIPGPLPVGKTLKDVDFTLDAKATVAEDGTVTFSAPDAPTQKP